jgi:DNA polymerase-3 subunit beta
MLITCPCKALRNAFLAVAPFANTRHKVHEVLAFVRITASKDGVILEATSMDIRASVRVDESDVHQQGAAIVHAERFANLLKTLDSEALSIKASDRHVIAATNHSQWKLTTISDSEFPDAPANEGQAHFLVQRDALQSAIKRTIIATDETAGRFAFSSVLFEVERDKLITVATDGRRLAKMEVAASRCNGELSEKIIIPAESLQTIAKALPIASNEIRVSVLEHYVAFESDRASFWAVPTDVRFPQWRTVMPRRPHAARLVIPVGQVKSLLKQASLVLTSDYHGVDFRFNGSTLTLASASEVFGEARVELPVHYQGPPLAILMDYRFVLDFLEALPEKSEAIMEVEDEERAVLFSADQGAYEYVVMPMSRDKAPAI